MKRGLIIVLVLSMIVGLTGLSSFAVDQNYQYGGMMNGNFAGRGSMMSGDFAGRGSMMSGDFAGRGGMMGSDFAGRGGMMNAEGGYNPDCINNPSNIDGSSAGVTSENAISMEAAYVVGKSYLEKELSTEYTLDSEGIAYGDFYTFIIDSNDKPVGKLSVNALTSEVWLHNCRGLLQ